MDRIYMNRIDGQRRIHIEIHDHEVPDLLDDLDENPDHFAATRRLLGILRVAEETFSPAIAEGRRTQSARTAARQTTGQDDTGEGPDPCSACPTFPCRQCAAPAVGQPAEAHDTDRAAVLREAVKAAEGELLRDDTGHPEDEAYNRGVHDVIVALRRMAAGDVVEGER